MFSLIILVGVFSIGTCTIQDLPMYFFNVSSPSFTQMDCSDTFSPNINFTGWRLPIDNANFTGTSVRCYFMTIRTDDGDNLSIRGGIFTSTPYKYAFDTSAADSNQHQELARQYVQKGFPSLVNNSTTFDTINVFTFSISISSSNWTYQIVIATHSGNQFVIFLYSNSSMLSSNTNSLLVLLKGVLWQLIFQYNKLSSITNIDTPGVFVLLLNKHGVREPGTQFASIPQYFFDITNSTIHGSGFFYTQSIRFEVFIGAVHIQSSFGVNIFDLETSRFPHKSWLLQFRSVDPISELGVDIGNTIKRGFPEYPGANNIIIDTQQLWVKDMGVATYQIVVAGNDTNELYFIFLYGNINFSINASIGYGPSFGSGFLSSVTSLLSTIPQNSLNLYSNIDQPGVYVFKYNGSDVIMPNVNCTDIGCQNGGTCIGTTCVCLSSYTGPNCEMEMISSSTTTTEPSSTTVSVSPTINGTSNGSLVGGQIAGITVAAIIVIIGIII